MQDERSIQDVMSAQMRKVAPGTRLREALDMLISARAGALILIGEPDELEPLCNGGFSIDAPFTPQRLFELSKMDGAIIMNGSCDRILKANVHLVPDSALPTAETGMRHRTAERMSRQTEALAVAISQRRNRINLYLRGRRITPDDIEVLLAKANQAIQTLQNYRQRLDEMLERLTLLEFEDLVTLGDVAEVIGRVEMLNRVAREVRRYTMMLGTEGRLVSMQSDELTSNVSEIYGLLIRDYLEDSTAGRVLAVRERLEELPPERLLEAEAIAHELGIDWTERAEQHLRPRGYRALAQIPSLPSSVVARIVERFGTLSALVAADIGELDKVDGVGTRRAKAISSGLRRIRAHVSV